LAQIGKAQTFDKNVPDFFHGIHQYKVFKKWTFTRCKFHWQTI